MTFEGLLPVQSFTNFAQHRATRLSLKLKIVSQSLEHACFEISGPPVLIDAFEMAMSLGPADCLVRHITITYHTEGASEERDVKTGEPIAW